MDKAFYAFPSKPDSLKETIIESIKLLNKKNFIEIQPWTSMNPTGKIIITQILKKIDQCDLFLYDLSDLNPNVCFELGYAVAKGKKIWGTLDETIPNNKTLVSDSEVFSLISYRAHISYEDIVKDFCRDKPFLNTEESFISQFESILGLNEINHENKDILYLKSPLGHTASKKLSQFLNKLNRKIVEVDILENSYQPFEDILTNVINSDVIVVHLLSNSHNNFKEVNAVYSFIAGLSIGFNKSTLMLAPDPYNPPMDYRHLLHVHKTAQDCVDRVQDCVDRVQDWIFPILSRGSDSETKQKKEEIIQDNELSLIRFILGDGQAEHEEKELSNFFVETSQFHEGLNQKIGLFIGRKGTGKTANLFKIREYFQKSKQNFIVTIKPQSFRLEIYVRLIQDYFNELDIRSQITERIWEFIIYSSVFYELYEELKNKPAYYDYSGQENELLSYAQENYEVISSDFGEKIDYVYSRAQEVSKINQNAKSIIEIIFNEYLTDIKRILKNNLSKFGRIIILIDNLDKAWDFGKNIDLQCKVIYGLIGFHNSLIKGLNWKKGDIRFLIYLREDIYKIVSDKAREPDKLLLNTTRLEWNDQELLLRVIEERFLSFDEGLTVEDIWNNLFCSEIDGIPIKKYLFNNVVKRPRDLIYLIKHSISQSINHRNKKIESEDIKKAQKIYFEFLVSNTVTEYKLFVPEIKSVINSFFNCPKSFDSKFLKKKLKQFTPDKKRFEELVRFLINISFLGLKIDDEYLFSNSENDTEVIMNYYLIESKKLFQSTRFKVNYPFYIGLQK